MAISANSDDILILAMSGLYIIHCLCFCDVGLPACVLLLFVFQGLVARRNSTFRRKYSTAISIKFYTTPNDETELCHKT